MRRIVTVQWPLLGGLAKTVTLELAESRRLPSGDVLLRYVRAPGGR